ncbi:hypothetical protein SAMN04488055_1316 [Chitinophaga niabensis]|uniref:Helix-turn-helix domain-containing protein n=1 Tax=Chitinophaga niabensis TaxID=536979 RepID=A0A1N6E5E5_9BACT|nr:hypothetical protein SAMN04488055_1316 [Chitinophaga niabensis]
MESCGILMNFFSVSEHDCRIGKGHLALYVALFLHWRKSGYPVPFRTFSQQVMPLAKISAASTYHRLLKDLCEFGYIGYTPSFYKGKASELYFNCESERVKDEKGAVDYAGGSG